MKITKSALLINLLLFFLLTAGTGWAVLVLAEPLKDSLVEHSDSIEVYVGDKRERVIALDQEGEYAVEGILGRTLIRIEEGEARVIESPCPHKICTRMGPIPAGGGLIVCVPNRVSLRLRPEEEEHNKKDEVDAVVR